jgi:hypothetical protein
LPLEERVKGVSAEELVQALPAETLEALARLLEANGHSGEPGAPADSGRDPGS